MARNFEMPDEFSMETLAEIDREIDKLDERSTREKQRIADLQAKRAYIAAERAELVRRRAAVQALRPPSPGDVVVGG